MKGHFTALAFGILATFVLSELGIRTMAIFSPHVAYLAHAGLLSTRPAAGNLMEFLAYPGFQVQPHAEYFGYAKNNFGFLDSDFQIPKPKGRRRILAIGDSFLHGLVPYPNNVITQVEGNLRARCPGVDFEIYNMGISGAGPFEYEELLTHALSPFEADEIWVHFYVGNDSPNILNKKPALPRSNFWAFDSSLIRFMRNSLIVLRGSKANMPTIQRAAQHQKRTLPGGHRFPGTAEYSDESPILAEPTLDGDAWRSVVWGEMGAFYKSPQHPERVSNGWKSTLDLMTSMAERAKAANIPIRFILYPAEIQLPGKAQEFAYNVIETRERRIPLHRDDFDFFLPNQTIKNYCSTQQLTCLDITEQFIQSCSNQNRSCYVPQNTHWNILGNSIAGAIEAEMLSGAICGR